MTNAPDRKEGQGEASAKALCHACRSALEPGAKICPSCSSHQNRFWYFLQSSGRLALFVTLLIALAPWAANQATTFYNRWWGTDSLKILSFSDPGPIVFLNDGTRDLYITSVFMRTTACCFLKTLELGLPVKPGEIRRNIDPLDNDRKSSWLLIEKADNDFNLLSVPSALQKKCISIRFKSTTDPDFELARAATKGSLYTADAKAEISYRAAGREAKLRIPLTVTAYANPACADSLSKYGLSKFSNGVLKNNL